MTEKTQGRIGAREQCATQTILGNEPVSDPLNVEKEVRRFKRNPLEPLLLVLDRTDPLVVHGAAGRLYRAYEFYALSLERALRQISIGRRFQSEVRWLYGGGRRLSAQQKRMAKRYRELRPFFELDFTNCLIHARILLDRTIGLGRGILKGAELPSFTSFADHKKFLIKRPEALAAYKAYRELIVRETDWFEILKEVRDKYLMHASQRYFMMMLYPSRHDLQLAYLPVDKDATPFGRSVMLRVSIRRLAGDVETFLKCYSTYILLILASRKSSLGGG